MEVPSEQLALVLVAERLAELVNVVTEMVHLETDLRAPYADGVLKAGPFTFVVEWKSSGAAATVAQAIEKLRDYAAYINDEPIALVAVPFMGQAGRERCAEQNVAWIDLSGNAGISAPGLHILVEGKPNQYKRRGRPSSMFAPKSSRIVRWLLLHPTQPLSQREIARATDTDEGYTSKIVSRLDDAGLIVLENNGGGHKAAWLWDRFAGFRTVTLYLEQEPSSETLAALRFREDTRGSNVWLVVPNDEGVFHGASIRDGVRCVHPVQVYLDLSGHAERADEASSRLRAEHLNWPSDG